MKINNDPKQIILMVFLIAAIGASVFYIVGIRGDKKQAVSSKPLPFTGKYSEDLLNEYVQVKENEERPFYPPKDPDYSTHKCRNIFTGKERSYSDEDKEEKEICERKEGETSN